MTEKRIVFPKEHTCTIEEFNTPEDLNPDQVLIRTEASMISPGTEICIFTGKHSSITNRESGTWASYPHHPGYSLIGRIEKTGCNVKGLKNGDRVFAPAGHASVCVHKASEVHPVPEGVDNSSALFAQLAAISLNGVRISDIKIGETVVITGQGIIGLLATLFVRQGGALQIITTDPSKKRRELSKLFGADYAIDPTGSDISAEINKLTGGRMADTVIEASGIPQVIPQAATLTRKGGKLAILGSPHGKIEFDFYDTIHKNSLHILGAHISSSIHEESMNTQWNCKNNREYFFKLIEKGHVDINPLISETHTPDDFPDIYANSFTPEKESLGVIVFWN